MSRRFLFVLGSRRSNGNTELLARRAAAQLPAYIEQQRLSLAEPLVSTINNWAAYMKMNSGAVLRGNGTGPGDALKDTEALARARTFFAQDAPPARFPGGCTRPESAPEPAA